MYHSKKQAEKKLAQAKYVLGQIQKYRGKVFVNNGIDSETGAHPLQVHVASFLAHTRSIVQYAHKECKERGTLAVYNATVGNYPIIGVFRDLRNTDIHEMVIGTHTVISCELRLFKTEAEAQKYSEEKPSNASITNHLSRPISVTAELIEQLRSNGNEKLADAAEAGESLYETVEHEGEKDLHILCEQYIDSLSQFINDLSQQGVMS